MKLINETKAKVSIKREGVSVVLFPGQSMQLSREQVKKIKTYIDYFKLTLEGGKDPAPPKVATPPARPVQKEEQPPSNKLQRTKKVEAPVEEAVEPPEVDEEEDAPDFESEEAKALIVKYEGLTAAELRAALKEEELPVSGNRQVLLERLVAHFLE